MIETKSKCDIVADEILNSIRTGRYAAGDRLPTEAMLASEMGVSRVTIRESIKKLSMLNILTVKQGDGSYVKGVKPDSYIQSALPMLILDDVSMTEIWDARLCIESTTVSFAAKKCTAEHITGFTDLLNKMEAAVKNNEISHYTDLDMDFHILIAQIAGNSILLSTFRNITDILKICLERGLQYYKNIEVSYSQHGKIVEALKNNDSGAAKALMEEHLEYARQSLKD